MAKAIFWKPFVGSDSAPRSRQLRKFYCDVLGGKIMKVAGLRRENKQLTMERDISKAAATFCAKESE